MASNFHLDWVLINELAIGPSPKKDNHLKIIKNARINSILTLCNKESVISFSKISEMFNHKHIELPDHTYEEKLNSDQLLEALNKLETLMLNGPVYVHCVYAMERSPIICMAWLVKKNNLTVEQALTYLMQIHPSTNPLDEHLRLLNSIDFNL